MSEIIETQFGNIPNDEVSRERIRKAVDEMVDSLTREDAEKTLRKEIVNAVKEDLKISRELLNKFARWKHGGTVDRDVTKVVEEEAAYKLLFTAKENQSENT